MDITPVKFKFKYNPTYRAIIIIAFTSLILLLLLVLWSLLNGFSWQKAISALILALLLSSFFNDQPKTLTANHDGISIKKYIGCAHFPISDIIDIREPDVNAFKIRFCGAGYASAENKNHLVSTYLTEKTNILILESKFSKAKLRYAISCPDEESKRQLLNYMRQIRQSQAHG